VFVLQQKPYPERWQEAESNKRGVRGPYVRMAAALRLPEPRSISSLLSGGEHLLAVVRARTVVETERCLFKASRLKPKKWPRIVGDRRAAEKTGQATALDAHRSSNKYLHMYDVQKIEGLLGWRLTVNESTTNKLDLIVLESGVMSGRLRNDCHGVHAAAPLQFIRDVHASAFTNPKSYQIPTATWRGARACLVLS